MTNRKKVVLEILAREGQREESKDGFVKRARIYCELCRELAMQDANLITHPKQLTVILTAHVNRGNIEPFWKNAYFQMIRRRWRITLLKEEGM